MSTLVVEIAVRNAEKAAPIATVEGVRTVRAGEIVEALNHAEDRQTEDAALSAPIAEALIAGAVRRGGEETAAAAVEAGALGVTTSDATARRDASDAMEEMSARAVRDGARRIAAVRPLSSARRALRRSARSAPRPRRLAPT